MSTEGAEGAVVGSAAPRYYVLSGEREKGPYTLAQLQVSHRDGALGQATQVRAEHEKDARPLGEVLGMGQVAEPRKLREPREPRRPPKKSERRAGGVELEDVYAPPADDEPVEDDRRLSLAPADPGSYWAGFALGFFGGCLALFLMRNGKPETRRGVFAGFCVGAGLGVFSQILNMKGGH
jgi:hypothetical protein